MIAMLFKLANLGEWTELVTAVVFSLHEHIIGPIPWGHSGPLCHALSLLLLWTSYPYLQAGLTDLDEIWHDGRS